MTFTGGFDLESVTGFEAVFDERADAEAIARLGPTEHYTMVMHAGDMAWVLPELVWHLEDLRVGMAYQNHYIARLASKFVTVTLAGTGGDELFAGYPWRYGLVEDAHDPAEFERRHYEYWTRLVADADKPDFFSPETWETIRPAAPLEAYRERHRARRPPRPGHTRAVLRGEDVPPRPAGGRGPRLDGEQPRGAGPVPRQRARRARPADPRAPAVRRLDPASASCARQCRASSRTRCFTTEAGVQPTGRVVVPRPDDGVHQEHAPRAAHDEREATSRTRWVERMLAEHSAGRANHRLLIWSLLCFEWWNRLFIDGEQPDRHQTWHSTTRAR